MKLYNTLTRTIETFRPIAPPLVRMYVCGVTVYDYCHMGHARAYVVFDLLKRVLMHDGYDVQHVQNFTDIDDKIIQRAAENNEPFTQLTDRCIQAYFDDMAQLNIMPASDYPRATAYIPQMIDLIQSLIQKGAAYVVHDHVYFKVSACEDYGVLSKKDVGELKVGARVGVSEQKESPLDFVLWKPTKDDGPSWESPWGKGRPGWHTECVAMISAILGQHIDIHGGGADLQFPHHENELAQARCAYHTPFSTLWIHNGFVTIQNEKMAKSTGNFFTLREVLADYSGEVIRFFLLKTHYRAPLNYSTQTLNDAKRAYERLVSVFNIVSDDCPIPPNIQPEFDAITQVFWAALRQDLNVSQAVAALFDMHKLIHANGCGTARLRELGMAIGLFFDKHDEIPDSIRALADKRWDEKTRRQFSVADALRKDIEAKGYVIDDTAEGYRIRRR